MLVLSRRERDTIRFPDQGITVQVLNLRRHQVSLGVEAPTQIRVLRGELEEQPGPPSAKSNASLPRHIRHELRHQLNQLCVGLHLFREQMDSGRKEDADAVFDALVKHLDELSRSPVLQDPTESVTAEELTFHSAHGQCVT